LRRRLASILSLDTVAYGLLLERAEEATHKALTNLLENFVAPTIRSCEGRVFKKTGDGVLAEFSSIVQATLCGVMIQQGMRDHAETLAGCPGIQFRIGINLGEVIVEPDDLYGEDVNIAVRLEALAEPGGICVSQLVTEQVRDKLPIAFTDLGEQHLKNLSRPVHAFNVVIPDQPLGPTPSLKRSAQARYRQLEFPARPAIAVLPFANLSGNPDQEYFADSLTEELIARLAGWRALPVIARNSTFTFKKRRRDTRSVASELNARYMLEGTVRRSESRVRIGVQLAETETGERLFAERYDRELGDILAVQDDIARTIVGEISPELLRSERERVARAPQLNLGAYECYQRGLWHHYHYSQEDSEKAEAFFRRALELDADYGPAAAALATSVVHAAMSGWVPSDRYEEAASLAGRAVALDPRDPQAHYALGLARYHMAQIEPALTDMEQAIRLNPSHAAAYANMGFIFNYLDRPQQSLQAVTTAFRLSPADTRQFLWYTALTGAHYLLKQYEEAIEAGQRGLTIRPDYLHTTRYVAASLGQLGRIAEARKYRSALQALDGDLSGTQATLARVFRPSALARIVDGLRKAGFG
jgi:adenylate cyclase